MPIYNIQRKVTFKMKITATLLILLVLFLAACGKQPYTQWSLPEGAVVRLGKGYVREVLYSPDGARLAVHSSIGIWLYDTTTHREVALLHGHRDIVESVAFSPDGATLTSGSSDETILRLWDTETGKNKQTLTGHTGAVTDVAFSPDGAVLTSASGDKTVRTALGGRVGRTEADAHRAYIACRKRSVQPRWACACQCR